MARRTFLLAILFLAFISNLAAQTNVNVHHMASPTLSASVSGGPLTSRFVDPFMTTGQADRILSFLTQPYEFHWNETTTFREVQQDLSRRLSIELDVYAIEELGLSIDEAIFPALGSVRSSEPSHRIDVFNDKSTSEEHVPASDEARSNQSGMSAQASGWWVRNRVDSADPAVVTNGARLFQLLDHQELTLNIQNGQLKITSWDSAESHCCIRIVDVTPLVEMKESTRLNGSALPGSARLDRYSDYQSLIDLMQTAVAPDTWEALGGPSTIVPYSTTSRRWLVIQTPLVIQWKLQSLLNQLNQ